MAHRQFCQSIAGEMMLDLVGYRHLPTLRVFSPHTNDVIQGNDKGRPRMLRTSVVTNVATLKLLGYLGPRFYLQGLFQKRFTSSRIASRHLRLEIRILLLVDGLISGQQVPFTLYIYIIEYIF